MSKEIHFQQQSQLKLAWRLIKYVKPYWDKYLLIIILQMIQGTIHTLPYLFLSKMPEFVGMGKTKDYVVFCLLLLLPAFLFRFVIFESLLNTLNWYVGLKLSFRFRQLLYRHMEKLSLGFYQSRPVGEHLYRANADIDAMIPLFNNPMTGLPMFISSIYQTILMAYLISIAGVEILFYLALILIPVYAIVHYLYGIVRKLDYVKRARAQQLTAALRESIAGIRVVKAFGRLKFTERRYFAAMKRFYKSTQSAYLLQTLVADFVRTSPVHILWPLSLPLFAYFGLKGKMPIVSWFAVIYFSRQMLYFLDLTFSFVQRFRLFLVPAQRLFETLDVKPEIVFPKNGKKLLPLQGELKFEDVHFSYEKGFPILQDIHFKLEPGKKLAIVGPSGAGKSTIANLMLRLYQPERGDIKIDGEKISEIDIDSFFSQTGVILQDTFLFGGTIRDNIRYGNPKASDGEVIDAAKAAGIHNDIMQMPGDYNMDAAEGTRLSGGQKQRIAIARALVKKPKLLILDEATTSLDVTTENAIIDTLKKSFPDISIVMISHRISLVRDADQIVVLDKGKIIEQGTHKTLLQNRGMYCNLYLQQTDNREKQAG
ncbi:MAG: ABC transporter ATP-binding protein [Calditrichaeota bacterium]|nr:ABC transporter ATP-binding protein [Calditrichota bacterium]